MKYCKKSPCANCPYRKDAPLALWSVEEFNDLINKDASFMGTVYGCHKKDGHICRGFLIDQDKRNIPSIQLRMSLSKHNVTREYLDNLSTKHELYDSIQDMASANYPGKFLHDKTLNDSEEEWNIKITKLRTELNKRRK